MIGEKDFKTINELDSEEFQKMLSGLLRQDQSYLNSPKSDWVYGKVIEDEYSSGSSCSDLDELTGELSDGDSNNGSFYKNDPRYDNVDYKNHYPCIISSSSSSASSSCSNLSNELAPERPIFPLESSLNKNDGMIYEMSSPRIRVLHSSIDRTEPDIPDIPEKKKVKISWKKKLCARIAGLFPKLSKTKISKRVY